MVQGVPRTPAGVDNDVLEQLVIEHRPKAIFLNTTLQNPTGATFGMAAAFRLLQIAERYGLWVVEDDVNRELAPPGAPVLAAMEGLNRVLYVGGFSKTITPGLRCGYVVAERDVLRELARTKMAVGLTSSAATERIVEKVLTEGRYARHVESVTDRLKDAHVQVEDRMDALGLELFHRPRAGLFVWARLPVEPSTRANWRRRRSNMASGSRRVRTSVRAMPRATGFASTCRIRPMTRCGGLSRNGWKVRA